MEELLKVLKEIRDEVDWENEKQLISDGLLDSIDLERTDKFFWNYNVGNHFVILAEQNEDSTAGKCI